MPPKRVLVVDDDDDIRDLLATVVSREGFAADTAWDGRQALEALETAPPDLVILDLMLPGFGGHELLHKLQQGSLAKVPVVVVTGRYSDPAATAQVLREPNVAELMAKPVNTAALGRTLHRLLD